MWDEREVTEKNKKKLVQCPWCLLCRVGEVRLARHVLTAHPEHVEEWVQGRHAGGHREEKACPQ
jgi:predicted nicotinamide N-methyase